MDEEQLRALMKWVDARIDEKIEDAFGRDGIEESMAEDKARERLSEAFNFKFTVY